MYYNSNIHHRRSIRLKGYDYSQAGLYFVTICTQNREHLFGEIQNGKMVLNEYGKIVQSVWNGLPQHYGNICLHEFIIMPNHVHGIIRICNVGVGFKPTPTDDQTAIVGTGLKPVPTHHGLSEFIRAFKTFSAKRINEIRNTRGKKLWQSNYFEHIIKTDHAYEYIAHYITNNPSIWENDKYNTAIIS